MRDSEATSDVQTNGRPASGMASVSLTTRALALAVVVAAALARCSPAPEQGDDASQTSQTDTADVGGDALTDVSADTESDAPHDADRDVDVDAPADVAFDGGTDVQTDGRADAVSDAELDAEFDADAGPTGPWDREVPEDELTACDPWRTSCDGVCRYTMVDETACGSCGTVCDASQVCEQGTCVAPAPRAPDCDPEVVAEVLAEATREAPSVDLTCSLTLSADDVVTKSLRLRGAAASGVEIDCGGGTLSRTIGAGGPDTVQVLSQRLDTTPTTWSRPTDVVIRNCRIEGSVRVLGQGLNGEGEEVRLDSLTPGHRERAQLAAPTRVLLERLTIVGSGRIPLYLSPGTTRVTLRDSEITGTSVSTLMYLDAESGHHRIVGNRFTGVVEGTPRREQLAVDGSAGNLIASNRFEGVTNGGIFVYRNCGEGGTVRHQEPRRNVIAGNVFVHGDGLLFNYSVWVGSRNQTHAVQSFCDLDDGYDFGSSASDLDFAGDNAVVDNVFVDGGGIDDNDGPTWIAGNMNVSSDDAPVPEPGSAACVVFRNLAPPLLLREGETSDDGALGCEDGRLVGR